MNVVSLALYGQDNLYWGSLLPVVLGHHHLFPGWELVLHHDGGIDQHPLGDVLLHLAAAGAVTLSCMGMGNSSRAMLWRMHPIWDSGDSWDGRVEQVICRDLDCLPCAKDRRLVEAWIASDLPVHAISDNVSHTGHLMGGMVGFHAPRFRELARLESYDDFLELRHEDEWGDRGGDQQHLNRHVWPRVVGWVCEHRLRGQAPDLGNPRQDLVAALATPLPDVDPETAAGSDAILNHLGQAGFDVKRAFGVFLGHPHPVNELVLRAVKEHPPAAEFLRRWEVDLG
jgi:hypothetical protein